MEFKYERAVQPAPRLGAFVEDLTTILETKAALPRRERRSTQRLFEELRGRGYEGAHDSVHRFAKRFAGVVAIRQVADDETGEVADEPVILARHGELPGNIAEE